MTKISRDPVKHFVIGLAKAFAKDIDKIICDKKIRSTRNAISRNMAVITKRKICKA